MHSRNAKVTSVCVCQVECRSSLFAFQLVNRRAVDNANRSSIDVSDKVHSVNDRIIMDKIFNSDMMAEVEECRKAFERGGVEGCRQFLKTKQEQWKELALNIAVVGSSGVGKSSYINAIRGLKAHSEGAAAVGVTETTGDITAYAHPNNPLLKFWDLPGLSDNFKQATYLKDIKVENYDFFLLLSTSRFTEHDAWLGKEIRNRNKKFFYVRTKIAIDISNDKQAHAQPRNDRDVLNEIREDIVSNLKKHDNNQSTRIYLIDNYKPSKFDFVQLEQDIIKDFPALKRQAMILSMFSSSEQMIKVKVAELRSRIWKSAVASAAAATAPVPGVSLFVDGQIATYESQLYFTQLGLDDKSLQRHAILASVDFQELKAIVSKTCGSAFLRLKGLQALTAIVQFLPSCVITAVASSAIIEEMSHFVPFIGGLLSAPLSFGGTYYLLNAILDSLENVAYEVIHFCAEHAANHSDDDDDDDEDDN